jgi:tetratricopeptide (TPR) repeat protein
MKQIITLAILFFSFVNIYSQVHVLTDPAYRAEAEKGLHLTYNMDFDQAEAVFIKLKNRYPDHPAGYFLLGFNRYWQIYMSDTMKDMYPACLNYLETALKKNDQLEDDESYYQEYIFFEFMSHALMARLYSLQKSWMSAVNSARKIISPLKKGLKLVGEAPEFYFVAGVYNYYVATYHKAYPVVRPFLVFFPDGDEALGLEQMEKAGSINNIAQSEASFFLIYIYLDEIQKIKKGLNTAEKLSRKFPKNTWIKADYGRALVMNRRYEEGSAVLNAIEKEFVSIPGHETRNITTKNSRYPTFLMIKVYHYLGQVAMYKDYDFKKAIRYFRLSNKMAHTAGVEQDNYLAGNEYYLGVCYDNLSQRDKAIAAYKKTLDMEENSMYKDHARKYIKSPHLISKTGGTSSR